MNYRRCLSGGRRGADKNYEQPDAHGRTAEQIVTSTVRSLAKQRFRLRPTVHAHILQASDEELRA